MIWYTSDLHFGHRLVAGHRGFETTQEHDEWITGLWESVVRPDDHVWVLGDLAVSSPKDALVILGALPGVKHLVSGNHDPVHPMHRRSGKWLRPYLEVFESVQPFARRKFGDYDMVVSHFPYARDRHEARYMQWRLRDEGSWLLHGHTHGPERVTGREIHVGIDAWGELVSESVIHGLLKAGS